MPAGDFAKSIAVLPFANPSPGPENAFFCDGVHEDVLIALAKSHDLKVISRTSVMTYKTGERNLKHIGVELGVASRRMRCACSVVRACRLFVAFT